MLGTPRDIEDRSSYVIAVLCCCYPSPSSLSQANLYPDSSLRGLVPVDEIPLCHCRAEDGCDADCIK